MLNKNTLAVLSLAIVCVGVGVYIRGKSSIEVVPEEVLTGAAPEAEKPMTDVRKSGVFNPFDYHLIPGHAYSVTFKRDISSEALAKPGETKQLTESKVAGSVILNSVRYINSTVSVIAQ